VPEGHGRRHRFPHAGLIRRPPGKVSDHPLAESRPCRTRGALYQERRDRLPSAHAGRALHCGSVRGRRDWSRDDTRPNLGHADSPGRFSQGPAKQGQIRPWARLYHARAVARVEGPLTANESVGSVPVGPGRASHLSGPWCRANPPGARGPNLQQVTTLQLSATVSGSQDHDAAATVGQLVVNRHEGCKASHSNI
jgi:hypothetical protein